MDNKFDYLKIIFGVLLLVVVVLIGAFFVPWQEINWGKIQLFPGRTITVTGEAKTQQENQIALFTAGVTAVNDDKEIAINDVNGKIEAIIGAVKSFGIKSEEIKTQNLSVYQDEETYYEEGVQKRRPGQWRVNNSIAITLREVDRASDLADLLMKSGATNVNGPQFSLEEGQAEEDFLLEEAIDDARKKAEKIAQSSGGKLGKIISISEGYQQSRTYPLYEAGGGGGAPVEPGSETVIKTVTVVFELE